MIKKNSGILRFLFGAGPAGAVLAGPSITNVARVIQVLGAGTDVLLADEDGQLFGPSPGHDIVPGFAGAPALVQQPGEVLTAALPHSNGYIPASTKVFAFFQPTDAVGNTAGAIVACDTQVRNSQVRAGLPGTGNNTIVDPNGPFYLASIQVALAAYPAAGPPAVAGILIVELQHSEHDIPGLPGQDQLATVAGIG